MHFEVVTVPIAFATGHCDRMMPEARSDFVNELCETCNLQELHLDKVFQSRVSGAIEAKRATYILVR